MFLDADDILEPYALELPVIDLRADPHAVGAHGQVRFVGSEGQTVQLGEAETWGLDRRALVNGKIVDWPRESPTTLSVLLLLNRIRTPACVLLRRELVDQIWRLRA